MFRQSGGSDHIRPAGSTNGHGLRRGNERNKPRIVASVAIARELAKWCCSLAAEAVASHDD